MHKRNNIFSGFGLFTSSLLLLIFLGSCGAGSSGLEQPVDGMSGVTAAEPVGVSAEREASYTAGLNCGIPGGVFFPNVLNYGWRGGNVTEGFGPNWVRLNTANPANKAWIRYGFQEGVVGRLQSIRIAGSGTLLTVYMYNWNIGGYASFGTYDLSAGPINLVVTPPFAPNGLTYLKLVQQADASSRIDSIRTNVF